LKSEYLTSDFCSLTSDIWLRVASCGWRGMMLDAGNEWYKVEGLRYKGERIKVKGSRLKAHGGGAKKGKW